ncbi:PKD domain-containing protein [Psychroflexus lacisalsi]|uniref:PKD domain-containing protein n=1 Tax=Psychroflexus lacisalsi TaxID=503928 RepID=A0ABN1K4A5_9FLAO|nr:PKD domain-containing protein [Psychroflexus lacisalsi]MBZ9618891.1 carbohydrate binding domain-containing protein [Psychroflexus lacisalsi]
MKLSNRSLIVVPLMVLTMFQFSCEENDSGIDFVDFEARFVSEINNRTASFNNLSNEATSFVWDFGDATSSTLINPVKTYDEDGTYTVSLTAINDNGDIDTFQDDVEVELILIVNGNFENGSQGWIIGVNDNALAPVVTENGNSFYEVDITNPNPDQPFLVNLSQKLPITQGETYVLTFDAWSDRNRTIIAGIGLSGGDFSNDTQTVNLTDTPQTFELTLSSQEFGAPDARVLFDNNGEAGLVRIDNVSLNLQ